MLVRLRKRGISMLFLALELYFVYIVAVLMIWVAGICAFGIFVSWVNESIQSMPYKNAIKQSSDNNQKKELKRYPDEKFEFSSNFYNMEETIRRIEQRTAFLARLNHYLLDNFEGLVDYEVGNYVYDFCQDDNNYTLKVRIYQIIDKVKIDDYILLYRNHLPFDFTLPPRSKKK